MTAFWDISPRNLTEVDWRFRGAYCFHGSDDKRQYVPVKFWFIYTRLHGTTPQNAVVLRRVWDIQALRALDDRLEKEHVSW